MNFIVLLDLDLPPEKIAPVEKHKANHKPCFKIITGRAQCYLRCDLPVTILPTKPL